VRLLSSSRSSAVPLAPDTVWSVVACAAEGPRWYADAAPLRFRGALDRLVGGRGDSAPPPGRPLLEPGDEAGLWRVRRADGHVLDLEATVWAPGTVTLRTALAASGAGTRVTQRVTFQPAGLVGVGYLVADLPARETVVHLVHRRLLRDLRPARR
jgi:hypothetical protein